MKCFRKGPPSSGGTLDFSSEETAHSTFRTVNFPTRTESSVIILASWDDPSATCKVMVRSLGLGTRPALSASALPRERMPAPVSKTIGIVALPFSVTSTQKTPLSERSWMVSVRIPASAFSRSLTLARWVREGPSVTFGLDGLLNAARASFTSASSASSS